MSFGKICSGEDGAQHLAFENTAADLPPASPARPSLTFLYHELRPEKSAYSYALQCEEFTQQVELFAASRRAGRALHAEVSFDDGHMSDYAYALPVLAAHRMVAHFFITVGWTGQKSGYMGWAEVRALEQAGQRIGAHGWTHTLLTHCTAAELHRELVSAREALEDKLGSAITSMSLPGGRYNRKVLSACRAAGYTEIYTSVPRAEVPATKPTQTIAPTEAPPTRLIGRLNVRSGMRLPAIEQLLQPDSPALARIERVHHLKEAAKMLRGDTLYASLWARLNRQKAGAAAAVMTHP